MTNILSRPIVLRILSAVVLVPVVLLSVYWGGFLFQALLALLVILSVYEWISLSSKTSSKAAMYGVGVLYIFLSFISAFVMRDVYGFAMSVIFLSALWASDIGAYFSGKMIGGAKMAPDISPNKTWAGFIGAIVLSIIIVLILGLFVFDPKVVQLSAFLLVVSGVVIAVSGQAGDLLVSMLKRKAQAKDSGTLIPGHGGVLDRIDSLLLATPIFLALLWVMS
ncbi:MAG: phosphatidate cytidylyltransferase [Pseudomonadota bacterium]